MGASIGSWVRKRGLVVEILAPSAPGICCQPARSVLSLVSSGRGGYAPGGTGYYNEWSVLAVDNRWKSGLMGISMGPGLP